MKKYVTIVILAIVCIALLAVVYWIFGIKVLLTVFASLVGGGLYVFSQLWIVAATVENEREEKIAEQADGVEVQEGFYYKQDFLQAVN